jgi:hypothetical protein
MHADAQKEGVSGKFAGDSTIFVMYHQALMTPLKMKNEKN